VTTPDHSPTSQGGRKGTQKRPVGSRGVPETSGDAAGVTDSPSMQSDAVEQVSCAGLPAMVTAPLPDSSEALSSSSMASSTS